MFNYLQEFDGQESGFITCSHLLDAANNLGVDASCAFGLSADMESETIAAIQQALQAAIEAELAQRAAELRHFCNIGPYAGGFCTICGGRQP